MVLTGLLASTTFDVLYVKTQFAGLREQSELSVSRSRFDLASLFAFLSQFADAIAAFLYCAAPFDVDAR
jgi:hypothetical protein